MTPVPRKPIFILISNVTAAGGLMGFRETRGLFSRTHAEEESYPQRTSRTCSLEALMT